MSIEAIDLNKPDPDLIAGLDSLLERAKKGEIREIVMCWIDDKRINNSAYYGCCGDTYKMLGAIEATKQDYFQDYISPNRKKV